MRRINKSLWLTAFCLGLTFTSYAQEKINSITIKDSQTQVPLSGVTIENLSKKENLITADNGTFQLLLDENTDDEIVLKISFPGYETKEIIIDKKHFPTTITLDEDGNMLEDIVITGYTQQSRARTTGAVSKVDTANINKMQVSSLDQALQGQVPGLYVASPSGQPGAPGRVTIRGIGSLQDEQTTPLYILNGVPISAAAFSSLNPDDFEDISVLKDAAATAPYGSRGANGVVVITTKKGIYREDGVRITYQTQYGSSSVNNSKWDLMDTNQRLQFEEILKDPELPGWAYSRQNPMKLVDGVLVPKTERDYIEGDKMLEKLRSTNTDWRKKLLRNGVMKSHNLSFDGGGQNTQYYTSFNYYNQEGVLYNSGIERFNINSNITNQSGRLKSNFFINLSQGISNVSESDFDVSETNPVASLYFALPYEQPYDANGNLTPGANRFGTNALEMYKNVSRKEKQMRGILSGNFSFDLTDDLKITSTLGTEYSNLLNTHIIKPDTYFGDLVEEGGKGMFSQGTQTFTSVLTNLGLNYKFRWEGNEIEAIGLVEMNKNKLDYSGFTGYGLIEGLENTAGGTTPGTPENDFIPKIAGSSTENVLVSQLAMVRFSHENTYTFNASLRRDGSSRVPKENRHKFFYAFGASWNMKNEKFLEDIDVLSMARMRGSYGLTGNANGFASDFGYRRLYGPGQYNGQTALIPITPGNPNYNWEMNRILDVGVEFGLFKNRLIGEVDFYNRVTSALFIDRSLSGTTGFESISDNMGKIRNRGVELKLTGEIIKTPDFGVKLGVNVAYNKKRILSLGDEEEIVTEDYSIHQVGKPLGHFYMVRWAGVDSETGSPLYLDKEGNVTNIYNPDDAVLTKGSFDPALKGGFTANIRYKNWELNALFSFIKGMYRLNTGEFYRTAADPNHRIYNQSVSMLDMWQKPGDISKNPGAEYTRYLTDRELQKADYLKLRNITLNYRFNNLGKLSKSIKDINVFAQGQNLITWTNWTGQDPEDDNNWYQYEYPLPRVISLGVKVTF